ncbi:MAG: glycosyltransferase [Alphaproteobacteria bacterium]|nr:glycosyltransferase [Alphaproteobacteria bacterium]
MSKSHQITESFYNNQHFPLLSVITVTLDNYTGLTKTYNSLEEQGFTDFEWLVIDGGSNDETVDFLRRKRSDTRANINSFRFISQKDDGIYDAMNCGIDIARGHYLLFLNAGDALATPQTLETISHVLTRSKAPDFVYGDAFEELENGRNPVTKLARTHEDIQWGMFTHHQAMLYRRHTIRDLELRYSLRYSIASDYDFTTRFLRECKEIEYINAPICIFEKDGISQKNAWKGRKEQYIIRETLGMVPTAINLWILCVQTFSWYLKTNIPWVYKLLKPAGIQLARTKKIQ